MERTVTQGNVSVQILIYRGEEDGWILEVEDDNGGSTVWDDLFPTDQAALEEAMKTIETEGIETFTVTE